ncbi:RNA polymerase sigma-70 factor [Bacteroides finegoldii]|uniref:RNA polymerase sigma-70 factor n=1 Tax=Bacteroides finegoldii TaxID=338188 RepID=UPI00189F3A6B|nr:RNA polymerase sigma-70 factor [Bacteroides finegoldii]
MSDEDLIVALRKGDNNAFSIIYKRYWGKVCNFSRLYITSDADIEDIVQQVFLKLWNYRTSLKENESFEGFLFIATRNLIFSHIRKSFNENAYKLTVLDAIDQDDDWYGVQEEMEANELREYIEKLLQELPSRQQEIFRMSRKEMCSNREIAERLSISEKTVEKHITATLRFLRENIRLLIIFLSI